MTEQCSFSDYLRHCRVQRMLSQEELGRRTGLAKSTLSNWEAGRTRPCLPEFVLLLEGLGVSAREQATFCRLLALPRGLAMLPENERPALTGGLLRALRLRQRLSQSEVARRLEIRQGTLAKWEKSEDWPSTQRLSDLCALLKARPKEVEAILSGTFLPAPLPMEASEQAFEQRILELFLRATSNPDDPLLDLDSMALDSLLWNRADDFARRQRGRLWRISALYLELQGRYEEALSYTNRLLATPEQLLLTSANQSIVVIHARALVGLQEQRRPKTSSVRAAREFMQAHASAISEAESQAWYWMYMATLLIREGNYTEGWECVQRSNAIPHPHGERLKTAEACFSTANHLVDLGQPQQALELLSTHYLEKHASPLIQARHAFHSAKALLELKHYSEAARSLDLTYQLLEGEGMDFLRRRADTLSQQLSTTIREI